MIRRIRGTKDILPTEMPAWHWIEATAHRLAQCYGFQEIRIPIFEETHLFVRSIGGATDIVEKEMYTFLDRDGTSLTLRPEGTAGVVRAFIENNLAHIPTARKLYYMGPMFRHERPQAGRFRQFHQFGVEAVGNPHPQVDIEVISLLWRFFSSLDIPDLEFEINSLGEPEERRQYQTVLSEFLQTVSQDLCANCQTRMTKNPLRVLDCKVPSCQTAIKDAPLLHTFLSPSSQDHFGAVLTGLDLLTIPYKINQKLVRGLDYYTKTTFEVTCHLLGAQKAIGAGGRYDGLFEALGGKPTPGIGFAVGLERVVAVLPESTIPPKPPLVYVASFGPLGQKTGLQVLDRLRSVNIPSETDPQLSTLKAHLRMADRLGAKFCLIIGDDECQNEIGILKNMITKDQEKIPIDSVADIIKHKPDFS